ncbi:MAG: phenylalanine--tRNA ligase subunit alpha [Bdellovibrionales bacterium]|nr:phenylalanine--tRNA ligase subunit alpha [Bdellovibrionales bacterium]
MSDALQSLLHEVQLFQARALETLSTTNDLDALEALRVEWFGKKGALAGMMRHLGQMTPEQKPQAGAAINQVRDELSTRLETVAQELQRRALNEKLKSEKIDITLSGRRPHGVNEHPVQIVQDELTKILGGCGFVTEMGPEIEHEFFNFDALNIPPNHPSRAMQDTFYIKDRAGVVLRTHTSPVQVRTMLGMQPPIRMICPGRVYRADYDATHSPMFHQIEALLVDEHIHMGHLKGILATVVSEFFGVALKVRLRPSFFPFTEPSAEVDIECCFCRGKGCKTCKGSGWIEIGGCGMVDPEVFKAVGIDADKWRGFAFGMGIERMAMLKYGVEDLRSFYESDDKFISEFGRWRP